MSRLRISPGIFRTYQGKLVSTALRPASLAGRNFYTADKFLYPKAPFNYLLSINHLQNSRLAVNKGAFV